MVARKGEIERCVWVVSCMGGGLGERERDRESDKGKGSRRKRELREGI